MVDWIVKKWRNIAKMKQNTSHCSFQISYIFNRWGYWKCTVNILPPEYNSSRIKLGEVKRWHLDKRQQPELKGKFYQVNISECQEPHFYFHVIPWIFLQNIPRTLLGTIYDLLAYDYALYLFFPLQKDCGFLKKTIIPTSREIWNRYNTKTH